MALQGTRVTLIANGTVHACVVSNVGKGSTVLGGIDTIKFDAEMNITAGSTTNIGLKIFKINPDGPDTKIYEKGDWESASINSTGERNVVVNDLINGGVSSGDNIRVEIWYCGKKQHSDTGAWN